MFKLETHCHTSEVSGCSRLPAVQLVTQLKRSGYGGAVITDHFHHGYFDSLTGSWTQKIDCFLSGYRAACEAGAQAGLHIYCGLSFAPPQATTTISCSALRPNCFTVRRSCTGIPSRSCAPWRTAKACCWCRHTRFAPG